MIRQKTGKIRRKPHHRRGVSLKSFQKKEFQRKSSLFFSHFRRKHVKQENQAHRHIKCPANDQQNRPIFSQEMIFQGIQRIEQIDKIRAGILLLKPSAPKMLLCLRKLLLLAATSFKPSASKRPMSTISSEKLPAKLLSAQTVTPPAPKAHDKLLNPLAPETRDKHSTRLSQSSQRNSPRPLVKMPALFLIPISRQEPLLCH